jgi:hypothetical protein
MIASTPRRLSTYRDFASLMASQVAESPWKKASVQKYLTNYLLWGTL